MKVKDLYQVMSGDTAVEVVYQDNNETQVREFTIVDLAFNSYKQMGELKVLKIIPINIMRIKIVAEVTQ